MLSNIDPIQLIIFFSVFSTWLFWMWMLLESLTIELLTGKEKFGWVVFISTTFILGAFMYFIIRRPRRIAEVGEQSISTLKYICFHNLCTILAFIKRIWNSIPYMQIPNDMRSIMTNDVRSTSDSQRQLTCKAHPAVDSSR